jgi:hypothetical protein
MNFEIGDLVADSANFPLNIIRLINSNGITWLARYYNMDYPSTILVDPKSIKYKLKNQTFKYLYL